VEVQSTARHDVLRQGDGRAVFRLDQSQRPGEETRRVDEGDSFAVRRPGRLDVPAFTARQARQRAALDRHPTDGALVRERNTAAIGRHGGLDAAERMSRDNGVVLRQGG
jgi:hypothetical protein